VKKFNNTLEGTDCGDAGLPTLSRSTAKAKTVLRVVPKRPDICVRIHLSPRETPLTIVSHRDRSAQSDPR
jgi:hypothetical protein